MTPYFIIPNLLRLLGYYIFYCVLSTYAHYTHKTLLQHIAKHLGIETSGFISFGEFSIKVTFTIVEEIGNGNFWKNIKKVFF